MKKTLRLVTLAALCLLTACAKREEAPAQGAARDTLVVAQMGESIKTATVILADKLGYYAEEGLDVRFEQISNLYDASTALMEGKLDVLPYGMIPTCTYVAQGADLTVIGGSVTGASACVTLPENAEGFASLEGFRGKTVACVRPETGHMYLMDALRGAGVVPGTDVIFVEIDGFQSCVEAVLKGEADAAIVNAFSGTAVKQGLAVAFDVAEIIPDLVCCRQTASGAAIAEKRDALVRFELALLRAYDVFLNDQDTAIGLLAEFSGQSEDYVRAYLYEGPMEISLDPASRCVDEFYDVMIANGDIDAATEYDMADHVDSSLYKEALDTLAAREPDKALWKELLEKYDALN